MHPVPPDVEQALEERGLRGAYDERPPYQRNDYVAWIGRARREDTRRKRLDQMLEELTAGQSYMGLAWGPGRDAFR